jgi:hypothetical protein
VIGPAGRSRESSNAALRLTSSCKSPATRTETVMPQQLRLKPVPFAPDTFVFSLTPLFFLSSAIAPEPQSRPMPIVETVLVASIPKLEEKLCVSAIPQICRRSRRG